MSVFNSRVSLAAALTAFLFSAALGAGGRAQRQVRLRRARLPMKHPQNR